MTGARASTLIAPAPLAYRFAVSLLAFAETLGILGKVLAKLISGAVRYGPVPKRCAFKCYKRQQPAKRQLATHATLMQPDDDASLPGCTSLFAHLPIALAAVQSCARQINARLLLANGGLAQRRGHVRCDLYLPVMFKLACDVHSGGK